MTFMGFQRSDGSVGVRNYVVVIPTIGCANEMAAEIAANVSSSIPLLHNHACIRCGKDAERARNTLIGIGRNPNIHSALVVGIGCEPIIAKELADEIGQSHTRVKYVSIEESGNYDTLISTGADYLREMVAQAADTKREPCAISNITVGIKCGGSGTISAIASNPSVGKAADLLVAHGGTVIFTETAEVIGAERVLAKRAHDTIVAEELIGCVKNLREEIRRYGVDILGSEPTQGNIKGGLTTIEEKSLGAIIKSGSTDLMGVLAYAQRPTSGGLYFMDGTTQASQLFLGMAAAGAQIQLFSFGGGLPARFRGLPSYPPGLQTLPVIKVLGSPEDESERRYFDVYAGDIVKATESVEDVGSRIFDTIIEVASGKETVTESRRKYTEMLQLYANGVLM